MKIVTRTPEELDAILDEVLDLVGELSERMRLIYGDINYGSELSDDGYRTLENLGAALNALDIFEHLLPHAISDDIYLAQ